MKYLLVILLSLSSLIAFPQKKAFTEYTFKELMNESKAAFKMPRGFGEIPISPNVAQSYQYAIRDTITGFEARYFIKPHHLADMDRPAPDGDSATYKSFVSMVSVISVAAHPDIQTVEPAAARSDLNADYGLTSYFKPTPEFAPGFKNCITMVVRKDGVGEIYIFMLFNIFNRETEVIIHDIIASVDF